MVTWGLRWLLEMFLTGAPISRFLRAGPEEAHPYGRGTACTQTFCDPGISKVLGVLLGVLFSGGPFKDPGNMLLGCVDEETFLRETEHHYGSWSALSFEPPIPHFQTRCRRDLLLVNGFGRSSGQGCPPPLRAGGGAMGQF